MTRSRKNNENKKGIKIFSGLFFLAGLGVLVAIGISLGKETYRKRQIQKEVEELQSEIQKINHENSELSNLISYLSTQGFQEKEAREKLNLQKENEKMVVLKKNPEPQNGERPENNPQNSPSSSEKMDPNWKKWLNFFFAKNN